MARDRRQFPRSAATSLLLGPERAGAGKAKAVVVFDLQARLWRFPAIAQDLPAIASRGSAASWLFSSRRQAHFLLEYRTVDLVLPNV